MPITLMFDPVDPRQSFPTLEEGILQYWKEEDIFKRSVKNRESGIGNRESFSFYDGPPFATGLPHYGHLLAGTIKDVIPRYQTMKGKYVERRFGWDCHGLPVENIIEQENEIKDHKQIEEMGVGCFNDLCRGAVRRYCSDWRKVVERMGRWVDMDWDYRTMDPDYMESIWWVFAELYKKKLIYEGKKAMHICPRCVTPLSNFEVTQAYQDVTDQSVTAKFELADEPGTYVLAWTTTPWTLPGNLFLAVNRDIEYVKAKAEDANYVLAANLVEEVMKDREYEVVETIRADDLLGKKFTPLFPYFKDQYPDSFTVVEGDFVTTEDGTGIVHIAPGFGEDDNNVLKEINSRIPNPESRIPVLQHVTMDGRFVEQVTDFAGEEVKPKDDPAKTDRKVAKWLKENGKLFGEPQSYKHSYPHCWRCDSPLLNYATSSWFVGVENIKDDLLKANAKTSWVPDHIRDGRFGKWLEGARDWAISRNRYWGTPLPIWRTISNVECRMSKSPEVIEVVGSRDELMARNQIRFTKVTAIRHAESEGNLVPIYQCKEPGTDLTSKGKKDAKAIGKRLATSNQRPVTKIYCSPLARTQQTAEAIAKQTGAEVIVDDRLREVDFGEYEGKTVDFSDLTFVKERRAHKIEKNKPESIYHFEGMEPWQSVQDRIESFMNDILPKHRSEHIVVVTHADPVMNIKHFFTKEDPVKLSHQPYPEKADPHVYFWDHEREQQLDLHKDTVDDVTWMGPPSEQSVALTLVRHGETDMNLKHQLQGSEGNSTLTERGKKQAEETANALKGKQFDLIISSDLKRAKQTAQILSDKLDIPYKDTWTEFNERDCGNWTGKKFTDVAPDDPLIQETHNFGVCYLNPPNGEDLDVFLRRLSDGLQRLIAEHAGKKVLVVSHGGSIKGIQILMNNLSYTEGMRLPVKNAEAIDVSVHPFLHRIPEVLDCWFESGSMPYAQSHFPFENSKFEIRNLKLPEGFPADFIAEGIDQTRGWFYTLMVLSTALFKKPAFMNCIVNGIVLAEDGKKMSKKLKNYPEPTKVVDKLGADAIRFTLMSSPAVRGEDLRFSEKLVEETVRNVLLPLWNTYSFFVTYANAAGFEPMETRTHSNHPLDKWIRAEVQDLVNRMTKELDGYDLSATCAELHDTIDALTNWYVRLSRRRFAGKGELDMSPDISEESGSEDRDDALATLYDVILTISQTLAPFCPFMTDAIYLNLVPEEHGSIHLTDWPKTRELTKEEKEMIEKTRVMRLIVSLGMSIRSGKKVKARQPLRKATIALPSSTCELSADDLALLRSELNVKELAFAENPEELAESFVQVDARKVGPRLGGRVQEIIKAGKEGDFTVQEDGTILILDEELTPAEAQVVFRGKEEGADVAADRGLVVSLDTEITDELVTEGRARDLIRGIQRLRKESGLSFTDHITLSINGADDILRNHKTLIEQETRSEIGECDGEEHEIELDGKNVVVRFCKKY